MHKLVFGTALLWASLAATPAAHAAYDRVFVFGDSLSDNGNVFIATGGETETIPYTDAIPDRAYASGDFSNGPSWVNLLGPSVTPAPPPPSLSLLPLFDLSGGADFAFGGARSGPLTHVPTDVIPTMVEQVNSMLTVSPVLPADALYVVWAGGNDVRSALEHPADALSIMQDGLSNISDILSALHGNGAEHFLLMNMPDVSRAPAVAALGPLTQGAVLSLVTGYNTGLETLVAGFEASTGIDVTTLDMFGLLAEALDDPGAFGFTNVTAPCIFENGATGCSNPDEYFFWDGLHPTSAVHRLIADAVASAVAPVPIPATLPLLASALAIPALWRRRRKTGTDLFFRKNKSVPDGSCSSARHTGAPSRVHIKPFLSHP